MLSSRAATPPLTLAVLVGLLAASALAATIQDDAGHFKPETIQRAEAAIAKMKEQFNKELVVETVTQIPADRKARYDPAKKAEFFKEWAEERAKAKKVNGVYVLICSQPTYLEVSVGPQTVKKAFTLADRDRLAKLLVEHFRKKQRDEGLLDGVEFVRKTLEENLKDEPQGPLAHKLAAVKMERYVTAPGYSEGPSWRDGELFFCSGALLRIDKDRKVTKYLDLNPAGTYLCGDGHLLICDNKLPALLDLAPDGKVGVVVDQFQGKKLGSLNDLTVDRDGNVYWTDPNGSSRENPTGKIFRVTPDGRVDRIADNLAFPNGLEVGPDNKYLYVIESQTAKVLRYDLPASDQPLGLPVVFFALGGSGGDGCTFDAAGNLWVADFHRPETKRGRITVLSPAGKPLAHVDVPAKQVSNLTFGGPDLDEIFCTTGEPAGVFHARVGVRGFRGHPCKPLKILRTLDLKPLNEAIPGK